MTWLDLTASEEKLLCPLPPRSFDVEEIRGSTGQPPLAL
jgi:hypothetical protein